MAQTTVELRHLLMSDFKLFDFPYTFDDPIYKAKLEKDIIDFYYDYEIAFDTPDMFKRKFIARWQRLIPYYNNLYNTTLLDYDPLTNHSMTEAAKQLATNSSNSTANSHSFSDSDSKSSDYPQQPIAGGDYLAGASNTITDSTTDNTSTGQSTSNSDYTKTIEGITGTTYPELIQKHRDALLQINVMLINEMKPCFILVYQEA